MASKSDLLPFIKARKSTLEFSGRKVEGKDIEKILEAGRWTPSPLNVQPWQFIVIEDKKRISDMMKTSFYGYLHNDPALIISIAIRDQYWQDDYMSGAQPGILGILECYMSAGMAGANMVFEAQSLGIDSCIITPDPSKSPFILGLSARDFNPIFLCFGYGQKGAKRRVRERKGISEIVSYEQIGNQKRGGKQAL
ncbi:MAG: nitroreductase family protein [Candidatus Micrarchaeia archaeon]